MNVLFCRQEWAERNATLTSFTDLWRAPAWTICALGRFKGRAHQGSRNRDQSSCAAMPSCSFLFIIYSLPRFYVIITIVTDIIDH
jgi:hypothetical protein